jgi:hypothetical protein
MADAFDALEAAIRRELGADTIHLDAHATPPPRP